ncbi:hypothetical protein KYI07_07780 [Macrococcus psychrotolerans]|nr:hypothetical protein [Macrococcus caseolyticus]QQB06043.1 hypothetical protein I6H62_02460 [Macrococcus caseolyticus]QYA37091.1 hypothetical protein KYI07_07780 [Macrococcus caseolyticus]QYA75799.1 hypothetical protein KYI12_07780 [Macrococcus caseolyticus]
MDLGTIADSATMGIDKLSNPLGNDKGKSTLINFEGMEDSIKNMKLGSSISFDRPLTTLKATEPFKLSGNKLPLYTVMYGVNRVNSKET